MSILAKFSKDTVVYGLGKGLKKFIGLLLLPLYTNALNPSQYGVLDTLGTFLFFITLFLNFGLDSAAGLYFFQPKNEKEQGKILFTVFLLRLVIIIPSLIASFFCSQLSVLLFDTSEYSNVILITCLLIPTSMIMSEQEMVYRFYRNAWGFNLITLAKSLLNIGAGILLVSKYNFGVFGAQLAALISTLVVIIISFFTFTRKKYNYQFSVEWAKKMLKFGFPLIWSGVAVWVYSVSDRLFLLHYRDLNEIGHYSIGSTFSQPIGLINMAVQMSFGVLFYEIYHQESETTKPKSKEFMNKIIYIYISIAAILSIALSLFSHELISTFTTSAYLPGMIAIPILCTSMIFAQIVEIVPVGISLAEKTWHFTWIIFVSAIVNAGLNFIFIPAFGVLGAAITTLIANVVYFFLADYISKKYYNSNFSRFKVYLFVLLTFSVSFFIPFMEVIYSTKFNVGIKLLLFTLSLLLPFIFQLISVQQLTSFYKMLKPKFSK